MSRPLFENAARWRTTALAVRGQVGMKCWAAVVTVVGAASVIGLTGCSTPAVPGIAGLAPSGTPDQAASAPFSTDSGDGAGWQLTYQVADAQGHRDLLKTIAFRPDSGLIGEPENGTLSVFHTGAPAQDCYPGWPCKDDPTIAGDASPLLALWSDPWSGPLKPVGAQPSAPRTVADIPSECLSGRLAGGPNVVTCRSVADHFLTYQNTQPSDGVASSTTLVRAQRGAGTVMFHPEQQPAVYAGGARDISPLVGVAQPTQLAPGVTATFDKIGVNSGCTEQITSRKRNYVVARVTFHSDPTTNPQDEPEVAPEGFYALGETNDMVDAAASGYNGAGCVALPDVLRSGYLEPGETRTGDVLFQTDVDTGRLLYKWRPGIQVEFSRQPTLGQ